MTLASLVVKLGAETLEFRREMENAAKYMERVGRRISKAGREISAAISLPIIAAAVLAFTAALEDSRLHMGKLFVAFDRLKQHLLDVRTKIGNQLTPVFLVFISAANRALSVVSSLADAFASLPPGVQKAVAITLTFLAVLGPAILILGKIVQAIAALRLAIVALSSTVGLWVLGITVLIAALVALWNHFHKGKGAVEEFSGASTGMSKAIKEQVRDIQRLNDTAIAMGNTFNFAAGRAANVKKMLDAVIEFDPGNVEVLKLLGQQFRRATADAELFANTMKGIQAGLTDVFTQLGTSIGNVIQGIAHGFHDFRAQMELILGNMLVTLGQTLIAYGVAGVAISSFITNPFAAIAAGVALVALGTALAGAAQRTLDISAAQMPGNRPAGPAPGGGGALGSPAAGEVQGTATIVVQGDPYLDMTDPRKRDALARAFRDLQGYRNVEVVWRPA